VLRALIFDVDGTLAETEADGHRVAFNRAFAEAGLAWEWDEALYERLLAVTGGKERIAAWWHEVDPAAARAADADARIRALHARKTEHYAQLVRSGAIALRPGVRRLIDEASSAGLTLAIATTTTPANVAELLDHSIGSGAVRRFTVIGAGDVVQRKKPAPDIYAWVLERLGLPAEDCVAIEDSEPGVAAALAARLPTVLTRSRYSGDFAAPGVRADLDQLGEPGRPASGTARGGGWRGVVDLATLAAWHEAIT
jgi:HAD superfamily hydrolase (TIGR01509 family)